LDVTQMRKKWGVRSDGYRPPANNGVADLNGR